MLGIKKCVGFILPVPQSGLRYLIDGAYTTEGQAGFL